MTHPLAQDCSLSSYSRSSFFKGKKATEYSPTEGLVPWSSLWLLLWAEVEGWSLKMFVYLFYDCKGKVFFLIIVRSKNLFSLELQTGTIMGDHQTNIQRRKMEPTDYYLLSREDIITSQNTWKSLFLRDSLIDFQPSLSSEEKRMYFFSSLSLGKLGLTVQNRLSNYLSQMWHFCKCQC